MAKKQSKKSPVMKAKKGVKKGTKRGPYNKNKEANENSEFKRDTEENFNSNTVDLQSDNLNAGGDHSNGNDSGIVNDAVNLTQNDEEKLKAFIDENKTPDDYEETPVKDGDEYAEQETNDSDYQPDAKVYSLSDKRLINGRMLLSFCDALFPTLILKVMRMIKKNDERLKLIKSRDIKLTDDQKEDMEELADEMAKMLFDDLDPRVAFFIMMGTNYYNNLEEALNEFDKPQSKAA